MSVRRIATLLLLSFVAVGATAATAPASRFEAAARRFVINFSAGRLEAAARNFNDEMRATVTPSALATMKKQFDEELGYYMSVTEIRERSESGFPVVDLTARFAKASVAFQFTFDAASRIGAIHFNRVPTDNPALEKIAREVLDAFNGRRFGMLPRYFDAKMRAELPPPAMEKLYSDVAGVYGQFKSVKSATYTTDKDHRVITLSADYEKQPALVEIVFDNDGRVAGWRFRPPR